MKKVFLLLPTLSSGGAERVMSNLAGCWISKGYDITLVLAIKSQSEQFYSISSDIPVKTLCYSKGNRLHRIISKSLTILNFIKLVKADKPDVVLSFLTSANIVNSVSRMFCNYRCIVSERDYAYYSFSHEILLKLFLRFADGIVAQTGDAKELLLKKYRYLKKRKNDFIKVIPNPINIHSFLPPDRGCEQKTIVNLARLTPQKGQAFLIRAFCRVAGDYPDWKLMIYGKGPLEDELKKQIELSGLGNQISIHAPTKEVPDLLHRSAVFVLSSNHEGFPNALAEAQAAGVACISTDCKAGPSEIIKSGENGFLVPVNDEVRMAQALQSLMADQNLRHKFGDCARERSSRFALPVIAEQFWGFISNQ